MRTQKRWRLTLVALVTCLAALTAGSMTGAGAQSGSTQGVSDTEIKVGGLGDSAAFFTEATMGLGAQARFARANKTGELPGKRKINMVAWGDIKADSATSVQEERRLIEQEGVFAIVPTSSVYTSAQVPNQRHVPVFGFGIAPAYCSALNAPNYFFGFDGCVVPPADTKTVGDNTSLMIEAAEKEGIIEPGTKGRIAIIGPDNDAAKQAIAGFVASSKANGLTVAYAKAATPAPPAVVGDYTPYVSDVLATEPDIIFSVGVFSDYTGLAKALQAASYEGMYVIPAADPQLAPAVGVSYAETNWGPNESASTTPAIQQMLDDFEDYEPGTVPGNAMAIGWLSADHFIAALEEGGQGPHGREAPAGGGEDDVRAEGAHRPHPVPEEPALLDAGVPRDPQDRRQDLHGRRGVLLLCEALLDQALRRGRDRLRSNGGGLAPSVPPGQAGPPPVDVRTCGSVEMDLGVSGRNFVIVGGTTGMGFAAATALAGDGANVALLARDGERAAQRARTLAVDHGVRAVGIAADGTNRGDLADAIDRAATELGPLRGLAVTAGPMNQQGPFDEHADDSWDWYYEVILMMTVRACRAP